MTTTTGGSAGDREVLRQIISHAACYHLSIEEKIDAIIAAGFGRGPVDAYTGPRWPNDYLPCSHGYLVNCPEHCRVVTRMYPAPPQPDTTDKPSGSHEGTGVSGMYEGDRLVTEGMVHEALTAWHNGAYKIGAPGSPALMRAALSAALAGCNFRMSSELMDAYSVPLGPMAVVTPPQQQQQQTGRDGGGE